MRIRTHATAATICLAIAGCSGAALEEDDAPPVSERSSLPVLNVWTAGLVDQPRSGDPPATLIGVRTAAGDGFDRVVFEFDRQVPGYHIEYIDRPVRQCGSGKVTELRGEGWLEVRMYPVHAHTGDGRPTVVPRERVPGLPVLSELELTCDFEAVVTWVFGLESPNRYRVRELDSPPRLIIDVQQ